MSRSPDNVEPAPVLVLDVDLSEGVPGVAGDRIRAGGYEEASVLVRKHSFPLGLLRLDLPPEGLDAVALEARIESDLAAKIAEHDAADSASPTCAERREQWLLSAPTVSVIVPSRDRPDRLRKCLDSLLAMAYPSERVEFIIVDNVPSTDGTRRLLADEYEHAGVRYVRSDRSGSASARNDGLTVAGGQRVVFTDDDVLADRHWLTEMVRAFDAAPDVGCVTGLIVPAELETPAQVWFEEYGGFGKGFEQKIYDLETHRPADPLYPFSAGLFGSGNSMAFDRATLGAMGNFDPALGNGTPALGGVDLEVFFRTLAEGHKLVYTPDAVIHHFHRRDYDALRKQVYNFGAGVTAFVAKAVTSYPRMLPAFLRSLPHGVAYALDPRSPKHATKSAGYPSELRRRELAGMAYGPIGYVRSRRAFGPHPAGPRRVSRR